MSSDFINRMAESREAGEGENDWRDDRIGHGMQLLLEVQRKDLVCYSAEGQFGSVKQKRLPSPGTPLLSAQMRPSIASTSCLQI